MLVYYHPHAKLRMRQRRVSDKEVREVLEEPELTRPADRGRTWFERRIGNGKQLKVVAIIGEVHDNEYVVYTVAWRDDNDGA